MPNQNLSGPMMGDWNVTPVTCRGADSKASCKYTYSTWCPTCERDPPRRRSRSESLDTPCRRKGREMKTSAPKRSEYNLENLEYDVHKEYLFEPNRVRSNLCELPTSYVNNCQVLSNHTSQTKLSPGSDFMDYVEKGGRGPQSTGTKAAVKQTDPVNGFKFPKLISISKPCTPDEPQGLSQALCYDTCTYFDKKHDDSDLQTRYNREIDVLRSKLKKLKGGMDVNERSGVEARRANLEGHIGDVARHVEFGKLTPKASEIGLNMFGSWKVSVKTRRPVSSANTLKKIKPKAVLRTRVMSSSSEGSDGENTDDSGVDNSEAEKTIDDVTEKYDELSTEAAEKAGDSTTEDKAKRAWPLRNSLFPNVPPYILFNSHDGPPHKLPSGGNLLKWKLTTITPIVIRKTLHNTGFRLVRKSNDWVGTWGKHMKSPLFKTLKVTQKLNHFPGTFQIGRKDRLWRNFQRMVLTYGQKEFSFLPQSYILPHDMKQLKTQWEFKRDTDDKWIVKPPASARGVGINVINKWAQVPKRGSVVVQRYISNPYLINGNKFDLRLYVLVTCYNPLRIYLFREGLARFASAKYSADDKDLKDRFMHLTNYSVNKLSSQYTANEDANACHGHKWTLTKLFEYLAKHGVNIKLLKKNLKHLVIKTIITGESPITQHCTENVNCAYNCYELFGIDVLLDESLRAWLLEVNISPSLHSASPLDVHVKGPLVRSMFDMAQFQLPPRLAKVDPTVECFDAKLYAVTLTKKEKLKQTQFAGPAKRGEYLSKILEELTGDDVRQLIRYEDELTVRGQFEKIFPTFATHKYLQYLECQYYNRLFDAWETKHHKNRTPGIKLLQSLCEEKVHLKVAPPKSLEKSLSNMNLGQSSQQHLEDPRQSSAVLRESPPLYVNVLRPSQLHSGDRMSPINK